MQESDPIVAFTAEFERAKGSESFDAGRCALATTDAQGHPSVRFVLLKGVDDHGLRFFTNYDSPKAADLDARPYAELAFHWHTTGVQIRVRGPVVRLDDESSDAYFRTRDRGSQIGAWASAQSKPLESREALEARVATTKERFKGQNVPRPPNWGGYLLQPEAVEFWYNQADRLHDRFLFERVEGRRWKRKRLAP